MQKRFAAVWIRRVDLRRCIARILPLVLCCVFMVALSQTAEAADGTGNNFAKLYGLDLEGGEKKVTFESSGNFKSSIWIDDSTSMEDAVVKLNKILINKGYTASYDATAGFIVTDKDGGNLDLVISADGNELTMKAPLISSVTSDGMSALLSAFDMVVTLLNKVWTLMLSNPLMTLFLAAGLLAVGVRAFRQLKRAAR